MTEEEFQKVLAKWVNKDLFKFENGRWKAKFEIV